MSKKKLFDEDSEEENVSFKTENEYAKKYDTWREKEEIHKLEQKYGSKVLNTDASVSSDSEDESDEPPEVTEEMETQFLKTLALLKTKDPRIYDSNYKFFEGEGKEKEKKPKTKSFSFADSDDEDDDDGDIFKVEKVAEVKSEPEKHKNEKADGKPPNDGKLKDYLIGKAEHVDDEVEQDLAPLKALWSDPKLNEGEAFLRDYILNKRYLDEADAVDAEDKLRDDEDLQADEQTVEEQGKFERAYNFRFEEPDEEYLKRFPRTMNYIRPKDDKRSRKRTEVRARKEEEKKRKMQEIARLKALKLKEIQEKIAKLKEVTGNQELAFKDEDIEGDFDPEEHDRRMKALFDEQYYGEADGEKPVFPDLDDELEIENWENYEKEYDESSQGQNGEGPHCEDEDFNMDAEYDPKQAKMNLLEELKKNLDKKRRNRKRKSKLAKLLETDKPKFIPTVAEKTYSQYMEEYYKMDCEDVIGGDLPTRFKYREVVPNDFGLTAEEILLADDKELTQWVPLKNIVKHRPENLERGEVKTYAKRAADINLKKKVLPSLFKELPQEPEIVVPNENKKKKKKKDKQKKNNLQATEDENITHDHQQQENTVNKTDKYKESQGNSSELVTDEYDAGSREINKKKSKKHKVEASIEVIDDGTEVHQERKKKKKRKDINVKISENNEEIGNLNESANDTEENNTEIKHKKRKKHKTNEFDNVLIEINQQKETKKINLENNLKRKLETNIEDNNQVPKKKKKNKNKSKTDPSNPKQNGGTNQLKKKKIKLKQQDKFKNKQHKAKSDDPLSKLSDERLKAYGLNPKKYRGFLKYKKF